MTSFNKRYDKAAEKLEHDRLLCKVLAAQGGRIAAGRHLLSAPSEADSIRQHEVAKYGIVDHDPDRKRELGEIEIDIGTEQRRIRTSHNPQDRTINLHGVNVQLADLDPGLARSFEATAARFNEMQGTAEQETQRELLAALLDRIVRRHKFVADALVRQLHHERYQV